MVEESGRGKKKRSRSGGGGRGRRGFIYLKGGGTVNIRLKFVEYYQRNGNELQSGTVIARW